MLICLMWCCVALAADCDTLRADWLAGQTLLVEDIPARCADLEELVVRTASVEEAQRRGQFDSAAAEIEQLLLLLGPSKTARRQQLLMLRAEGDWGKAEASAALLHFADAVAIVLRIQATLPNFMAEPDRRSTLAEWCFRAGYEARFGRTGAEAEARRYFEEGLRWAEPGSPLEQRLSRQLQHLGG